MPDTFSAWSSQELLDDDSGTPGWTPFLSFGLSAAAARGVALAGGALAGVAFLAEALAAGAALAAARDFLAVFACTSALCQL